MTYCLNKKEGVVIYITEKQNMVRLFISYSVQSEKAL